MKVNEAIEAIRENSSLWARPISWRLSGVAIHVNMGTRLSVVPSSTGGQTWFVRAEDLVDDWEVIDPDLVLDEAFPLL
jgi:hypothetical protein